MMRTIMCRCCKFLLTSMLPLPLIDVGTQRWSTEMKFETMRDQLAAIEAALERNEAERAALQRLLKAHKGWFRFEQGHSNGHQQLSMTQLNGGPQPMGSRSFRDGLISVLQCAEGRPMHTDQIWRAMVEQGVKSRAEDPTRFIGLYALREPKIEKAGPALYRWACEVDEIEERQPATSASGGGS